MRRSAQPEQTIKKEILGYLGMFPTKLLAIDHRNSGTMRNNVWCPSSTTILGVSDLIIFPLTGVAHGYKPNSYSGSCWLSGRLPFFAEIKTPSGKQSIHQLGFQKMVEALGYDYYIWRDVGDAIDTVKERGLI